MKKKICILLTAVLMALTTIPVFAATETTYGVVLDTNGNGMEINMDTRKPIDPYYNYIRYSKVNTEPGQIIYTIATTDEDGEWISRKDHPLNIWIEDPELNILIEIYELNQKVSDLVYRR